LYEGEAKRRKKIFSHFACHSILLHRRARRHSDIESKGKKEKIKIKRRKKYLGCEREEVKKNCIDCRNDMKMVSEIRSLPQSDFCFFTHSLSLSPLLSLWLILYVYIYIYISDINVIHYRRAQNGNFFSLAL
jgi:hypothetical protein